MNKRWVVIALLAGCTGACAARAEKNSGEPTKTPSQEQITKWLKKLEEPTRAASDPKQGPPDEGVGPDFEFRIHPETTLLANAGEAARQGVVALLENSKKSGQARAHAAIVLVEWLLGKGAKQEPDPKVLKALKEALKDKDRALKWGILHWVARYGAFVNRGTRSDLSDAEYMKEYGVPRDSLYFSDAAMDGLLPEIIALLADEEPVIATRAAEAIGSFGRPKQGVKELIALFDQREVSLRAAAAHALGIVGLDDSNALKALLAQLTPAHYGGPHTASYAAVVEAVGRFGPKAKDAVPALIEVLKKSEWKRRETMYPEEAAVCALGNIGPEAKVAVPWLLKYAETCASDWPRLFRAIDNIDLEAGKKARAIQKQRMDERDRPN